MSDGQIEEQEEPISYIEIMFCAGYLRGMIQVVELTEEQEKMILRASEFMRQSGQKIYEQRDSTSAG